MGFIETSLDSTVAHDQRDGLRKRISKRPDKGIAASGDQRDVNARRNDLVNRLYVSPRN